MKVVVAMDSFKGSLSSKAAENAVRAGVLSVASDADVQVFEVADGGEGTLDAIRSARRGTKVFADAADALGQPITSTYGVFADGESRTAVIEAARTIGLGLVGDVGAYLPLRANSYGLGLQLRHALDSGIDRILVALGGTATTDGGTGLLIGLGGHAVTTCSRNDEPQRKVR